MNTAPLILASASPRRAQLLRQLEIPFEIIPGHAPEAEYEFMTPRELCQLNAYRKARVVAKQHPDRLVVGADTMVCLGTRIFGKPKDLAEAQGTLQILQGKTHEVLTGVCLLHLRSHQERLFVAATEVTFRNLTATQITGYLERINPYDKAGAYAIQDQGELIVAGIKGSFSNVVGLPLEDLERELARFAPGR